VYTNASDASEKRAGKKAKKIVPTIAKKSKVTEGGKQRYARAF